MKTLLHISCTWIITSLFITITNFSFFKKEKPHLKHFCTLTKTSKEEEEKVKHWFLLLKTKWKKEKKIPQIKSQTQKPNQPNKSGEGYLLVGWWKNLWEIDSKLLWIGSTRSGGTGKPATIYLKIKAWCSSSCHCDTVKGDLIPVPIPVPLTLPPPPPPPPVLFISTTINQYLVLTSIYTHLYEFYDRPRKLKTGPLRQRKAWDRDQLLSQPFGFCYLSVSHTVSVGCFLSFCGCCWVSESVGLSVCCERGAVTVWKNPKGQGLVSFYWVRHSSLCPSK